jgi:DNA-binding transcriptional LysR family regulator
MDASVLPALYDVLTVARRGSVGAAAAALHKTPSAVSQQLRRVESVFGVMLFERHGRGLRLTAAGQAFLGPATRLFDDAESLFGLLEGLAGRPRVTVRIAVSDYLGKDLLAPVVRRLSRVGAPLRFEIATAHSAEALDLLASGDADLAVITSAESRPGLVAEVLLEQHFVWAAPSGQDQDVSIDERLRREPVLRLAPGSIGRAVLESYLAARTIEPVSTIDVPSVSLLLAYAAEGAGIGLAPSLSLGGQSGLARLAPVPASVPPLPVQLVRRSGYPATPAVEELLEGIRAQGRKLADRTS